MLHSICFINDYFLQERVFPLKITSVLLYGNLLVCCHQNLRSHRAGLVHHGGWPAHLVKAWSWWAFSCICEYEYTMELCKSSFYGPLAPIILMRNAGKHVPGWAKLTTKITQHLLPRAGLWLFLGSLPGRKMSWAELSAHLAVGTALCQEAEAVIGIGEDGQDRTTWEQQTWRG